MNKNIHNSKSTFTVDISDGFCTHRYSLLISDHNSISDVAKRIGKAFRVEAFHRGLVETDRARLAKLIKKAKP